MFGEDSDDRAQVAVMVRCSGRWNVDEEKLKEQTVRNGKEESPSLGFSALGTSDDD